MLPLKDPFSREFSYLRLSLTDRCNFSCGYCLPNGYKGKSGPSEELTLPEIKNLVGALSEMGFWKVRLTGGEPTLRKDIIEIARAVSQTPGIKMVALSTNGYRLKSIARELKDAGVSRLNISVDSLNRDEFRRLTGQDKLNEVLAGIDTALSLGFESIKINSVLLKSTSRASIDKLIAWGKNIPVHIRFIELMQTAENQDFFGQEHISSNFIAAMLQETGWQLVKREPGAGPAEDYQHAEYLGRVGIIAPYKRDFCQNCNRLRISSRGELRLCLFAERNYSLRSFLSCPSLKSQLKSTVHSLIEYKAESHYLDKGQFGNMNSFSIIGG